MCKPSLDPAFQRKGTRVPLNIMQGASGARDVDVNLPSKFIELRFIGEKKKKTHTHRTHIKQACEHQVPLAALM